MARFGACSEQLAAVPKQIRTCSERICHDRWRKAGVKVE
jgi:hypothetical protein